VFLLLSLLPAGSGFGPGLNPEELHRWVDELLLAPPEKAAAELCAHLLRVRGTVNRHARLRMLDMLVEPCRKVTEVFEAELNRAHHPLSLARQRQVVTGNELLKLHAACYRKTAEELSGKWLGLGFSKVLPGAVAQAMDLERRRITLAFRAYSAGSGSAWKSLHQLYGTARRGGFAEQVVAAAADSPTGLFVKSLLLAFAEPARLGPGELDRVRFYLDRHAGLTELHHAPGTVRELADRDGCFLIRKQDDGPGHALRKRNSPEVADGDLVLDCGPLLKKLREQIDGIEHGVLPSKLGLPTVARRPHYIVLLRNLLALWSVPPQRRHPRQHFMPRIDLVAGFDDLWSFIAGPAFSRRNGDFLSALASTSPGISEWTIANESPVGFALQHVSGAAGDLSVGALAGLRPKDRSVVHVCIVRRLVSGKQRPALGLQKLAPFAVPTMITLRRSTGEGAASRAIVLLNVPSLSGGAAVIVRPNLLQSGIRIPFRNGDQRLTGMTGAPIMRCPAYDIFALDVAS
jgi:hypothetical protein